MVAGLKQLGLLDGVKVADTSISNFKVINGTNKPFKIIGSNGEEMEIGSIINGSSLPARPKRQFYFLYFRKHGRCPLRNS